MHILKTVIFCIVILFGYQTNAQYKIGLSDNYPPYNFIDQEGKPVGFNVEILEAISNLYQLDINIVCDSWTNINKALENDQIDAIAGAHYPGTPNTEYLYSRSVIHTSHCFLYNSKHHKEFSAENIRTTGRPMVALWENEVLTYYIRSINPNAKFLYVANYNELMEALDREDVLCAISQKTAGIYYAKKAGKDYIHSTPNRVLERSMGFKISQNNPELAQTINNGLEIIISNGEYQRIYDKWIEEYRQIPRDRKYYSRYILIAGLIAGILFLLLVTANQILQKRVRAKTLDLRNQLNLNSEIMKELELQKIKAEESDRMKSAFLANMSHEIRTPMNGILGFAELLKSPENSAEERQQYIKIIEQSGERMLSTINNIIDVSKIEAGIESVDIAEVDINQLVTDLFNFFLPEAKQKKLKITIKQEGIVSGQPFYSDPYKLNSILINLIKNALKFTSKGSITIGYSFDGKEAKFYVKDTGKGIAPDKQEAVFGHFVQAESSHNRGFEGSGLGLSISRAYTEMLNGEIRLESELNKGSVFFISIPNAKPPQ
ncbi:MAG: ATP-binding protein [Tangfeifania sp.]